MANGLLVTPRHGYQQFTPRYAHIFAKNALSLMAH